MKLNRRKSKSVVLRVGAEGIGVDVTMDIDPVLLDIQIKMVADQAINLSMSDPKKIMWEGIYELLVEVWEELPQKVRDEIE